MDEWLTAGDTQFLKKAQRRVEAFVRTSSILVLASHSLELVEQWCNRGILLQQGRVVGSARYRRSSLRIEPHPTSGQPRIAIPIWLWRACRKVSRRLTLHAHSWPMPKSRKTSEHRRSRMAARLM
jgi:energy-coupling factor transporter ATP-binding protein EcfA2